MKRSAAEVFKPYRWLTFSTTLHSLSYIETAFLVTVFLFDIRLTIIFSLRICKLKLMIMVILSNTFVNPRL